MWRSLGLKMASPKLSVQDKKDLDKFAKYLVYKCIQIIVQSRLGEKVNTNSKAFSSGSDWFNLTVVDIPEVKAETMKVFGGSLTMGQNVCVEISLKTAEGETMILETWWLTMTEQLDSTARVSYTVYNRMAILLKSLFSVSRSTPAYQLSRKQGPETFVICYRIYMGEPQISHLGDGYQTNNVGGVATPLGRYGLTVAYRTKMLISPHTSTKDLCEDLKENHFNSDASPKKENQPQPCRNVYRERRLSSGDELMFGEPQDICTVTFTSSPSDHSCLCANGCTNIQTCPGLQQKPSFDNLTPRDEENKENAPRPERATQKGPRICAFAPYLQLDSTGQEDDLDVPFSSLLYTQHRQNANVNANVPAANVQNNSTTEESGDNTTSDEGTSRSSTGSSSTGNSRSQGSGAEDFVMVELKTPFAGPETNSDLGRFYQDCQVAPPLSMFQETATVQDTLNSITDQLASFEANSKNFSEFVESLQGGEG